MHHRKPAIFHAVITHTDHFCRTAAENEQLHSSDRAAVFPGGAGLGLQPWAHDTPGNEHVFGGDGEEVHGQLAFRIAV